jgi:hypothetical protein
MIKFLKEYLIFLKERKKYWLIPIYLVLIIISALIISTQGTVLAPFIYTLF